MYYSTSRHIACGLHGSSRHVKAAGGTSRNSLATCLVGGGGSEVLRRRDFKDSAENWTPEARSTTTVDEQTSDQSQSKEPHGAIDGQQPRYGEVVFFYRGSRYQRGTPTSVLRSGLDNMAPEVADWTVLRFSSPASHASGHGGITKTQFCPPKSTGR